MGERPTRRTIETGVLAEYQYIQQSRVVEILEDIGYGSSKIWVDGFYLHESKPIGVGVLLVTPERCNDHFELLRGVDQSEAIAQAFLLLLKFGGKLEVGTKPLYKEIERFRYFLPVVEDKEKTPQIDLVVIPEDPNFSSYRGMGEVLVGKTVVSRGIVEGGQVEADQMLRIKERRRRIQRSTEPLFPFQG